MDRQATRLPYNSALPCSLPFTYELCSCFAWTMNASIFRGSLNPSGAFVPEFTSTPNGRTLFDRRSHIFRIQTASKDNRNIGVAHDNFPADRPIVCLSGASNLISCYVDAVENETVHQLLEGFGINDTVGRNNRNGFEYLQVGNPAPQTFHRAGSNFAVKLNGRDFALLQQPLKFIYLFNMGYQHCFHRWRQGASNVPRNSAEIKSGLLCF